MAEKVGKLRQLKVLKAPTEAEKKELKKKVKSRFDGRWVIIILFILTIIASLFFYLRTEIPLWLQRIFTPKVIISKPPP